jgi:hypothetical protein
LGPSCLHFLARRALPCPAILQDASSCLDSWVYLCQLMQNPAVAERAPDAAASLELMSATWRKLNMAAMEQTSLTAAAVALQVRLWSRNGGTRLPMASCCWCCA